MGKCAGNAIVGIALFLALAWLIMICLPTGWHTKSTLIWNFNVGLYYVKVDRAILGSVAHMGASVIDAAATSYYRDMFCNIAIMPVMNSSCAPWEHLLLGSWLLLITTIMTIILLCTGAGFMWYYANRDSRRRTRRWAMGLFAGAAFVNLLGLGGYTALTFQFGMWLVELMITSARTTFSFVYVMAIMIHMFCWAPLLICWTCGANAEEEDIAEEMAWEKKKLLYGDFDDDYDQETHYDEYGNPVQTHDEYGNPISQYDEYGAPRQQHDAYGTPVQRYDEYGNPVQGSFHASAYEEHDPYAQPGSFGKETCSTGVSPYGSYNQDSAYSQGSYAQDPYSQQPAPYSQQDPYAQQQDPYAQQQDPYAQYPQQAYPAPSGTQQAYPAPPSSGYQHSG